MKAADYIELWVEDDGDTILCKRSAMSNPNLTMNFTYRINDLAKLKAELQSYGCDEVAIARAFQELETNGYNEEVTVK